MQERYTNNEMYFNEQVTTCQKYLLPFINNVCEIKKGISVLEIGCGLGGNLKPFNDIGCRVVGVDLSQETIQKAQRISPGFEFIASDIYDVDSIGQFEIIITRNVLEHIHDQERFMQFVKKFLKPNGYFFLAFPSWYYPFGGHQQVCQSKFLSILPYFHLLPRAMYKFILELFGENDVGIEDLLEIKETGITIQRFEKILKKTDYKINLRVFYFINPDYEVKFGLKPMRLKLFSSIPYVRDFLSTTTYYIVSKD